MPTESTSQAIQPSAAPSLASTPAASSWQTWPINWYSICSGFYYNGTVQVHFMDRTALSKDGLATIFRERLNVAGGRIFDNLGREYAYQENVRGGQDTDLSDPAATEGVAEYLYRFHLVAKGNYAPVETFILHFRIEWVGAVFEVTTAVETTCH